MFCFLGLVVDWSLLLAMALIILPMIFLSIEEAKESKIKSLFLILKVCYTRIVNKTRGDSCEECFLGCIGRGLLLPTARFISHP